MFSCCLENGVVQTFRERDFFPSVFEILADVLKETPKGIVQLTVHARNDGVVIGSAGIISGSAEIYAICLDGGPGIAVDNDALRGCAGYIFSGIDPAVMRGSFKLLNTKMIVLEFGGNAIGGIYSTKAVNDYTSKMMSQVAYFRRAVPGAKFLFVGPSDMSRSVNGSLVTWPRLEELNDSLRSVCLRNDVAYWDLFNMMGGRNSMPQWVKHNPPLAGPDYIHFTTAGANHVGEMLSKSFLLYYDMYKRRSSGLLPAMAPVPADSTVAQ